MNEKSFNKTINSIPEIIQGLMKNPIIRIVAWSAAGVGGFYILSLVAKNIGHSIENFKRLVDSLKK